MKKTNQQKVVAGDLCIQPSYHMPFGVHGFLDQAVKGLHIDPQFGHVAAQEARLLVAGARFFLMIFIRFGLTSLCPLGSIVFF